ncbi:MAG: YaiI/YqxD family protein [Nitrosomonadales bacterium]|nr:YaiI/YqxD family protein [Nitrosomonadales bacterium]
MQIWVDADACPKVIKEILFRAAERRQIPLTLVANKMLYCPPSKVIRAMQVPAGFDVADNKIAELVAPGDLVITADIPLAAQVIAKGGHALNPRGEFYTRDTIQERLTMRDFMDNLRGSGVDTGGPPAFNQSDRQAFANQLDRFLAKYARGSGTATFLPSP